MLLMKINHMFRNFGEGVRKQHKTLLRGPRLKKVKNHCIRGTQVTIMTKEN